MNILSNPKETKARKVHFCSFCGNKIFYGETYYNSTYVTGGEIYHWRVHQHCHKLSHDLKMYDDSPDGVSSDDFQEAVGEAFFDIFHKTLSGVEGGGEALRMLRYVPFRFQLFYVIRHLKKETKDE